MQSNETGELIAVVIYLVIIVLVIAGLWKMFVKANKPGWVAIIPFYNLYVILKIVGRPGWWLILYFIPFVNIIINLIVALDIAKSYNRSTAFGVVLVWLFPILGYPILGFGDSQYSGPAVSSTKVS